MWLTATPYIPWHLKRRHINHFSQSNHRWMVHKSETMAIYGEARPTNWQLSCDDGNERLYLCQQKHQAVAIQMGFARKEVKHKILCSVFVFVETIFCCQAHTRTEKPLVQTSVAFVRATIDWPIFGCKIQMRCIFSCNWVTVCGVVCTRRLVDRYYWVNQIEFFTRKKAKISTLSNEFQMITICKNAASEQFNVLPGRSWANNEVKSFNDDQWWDSYSLCQFHFNNSLCLLLIFMTFERVIKETVWK